MPHLECNACEELKENPVTLSCGHSSCRDKCLVQLIQQNEVASCSAGHELLDSSPLHVNTDSQEAIDVINNPIPEVIICVECEEAHASLFCGKCDAHHCAKCSSFVHKLKTLRSHSVVPLNQNRSNSSSKYPFHSSKSTILNSNSINSSVTFELIDHPQIRKTLGLCRKFVNRQTVALELCVSLSESLIDKVSKSQDQPYFHVCAGNRGQGKTTFALNFLRVLLENPGQYAKLANYSAFKVRSMNLFSYQKMARDLCYSFLVGKVIFLHNNSETAQEVLIWEAFSKRFTGFRPTQNGNLYSNMSSILFYHIEAVLAKTGKYCNVEGLCDDVRNMSCEEFLKLPFVIIVDEIQACEKPWVNLNRS
ncbi:hypothetical protein GEMRC1_005630 [Eukaryota sp. GEM-RC1]